MTAPSAVGGLSPSVAFLLCFAVGLSHAPCHALDNGLGLTPPMGWRSWNCYQGDVTDAKIRSVIDVVTSRARMVDGKPTSLVDLGYNRVGIDDGWQECGAGYEGSFHAEDGTPLVDESKFPNLKAMVEYGHANGVLMGWYDDNCICMDSYKLRANASWGERAYAGDVKQILEAGFDGVKIDNCGDDDGAGFASRMLHLNVSGRAVLLENSNQAQGLGPPRGLPYDPHGWCGANLFRVDGDIGPDFDSILRRPMDLIQFQDTVSPISRPGCWAYPDMLEVGNFAGPMATNESRTHFGLWCVVSSPLILGLDLIDAAKVDSVWDIITNREAIGVNQAWAGHPGRFAWSGYSNALFKVWAKKLAGGAQAVLLVNADDVSALSVTLPLTILGLNAGTHTVRDVWRQQDSEPVVGTWSIVGLPPHDSAFVIIRPHSGNVVDFLV